MLSVYELFIDSLLQWQTVVTVTITVTDVNDLAPNCGPPLSYSDIAEANDVNVRLGQVVATDGDDGFNADINYRIFSGDSNGNFFVDSSSVSLYLLTHYWIVN